MHVSVQDMAALERINYEATLAITQVTPGLALVLRDDVILTSSELFPIPDTTHACLLRAAPEDVDDLIIEVIDYFKARELPTTIFVSPACTPVDLPKRLLRHGFSKGKEEEAWLVFNNLLNFKLPLADPKIVVKPVSRADVLTFTHTFLTAFEMPDDFAPSMAQLMEPSLGLPGIYHYLAFSNQQPIATCSLFCYQNFGIIGSVGVVPGLRGSRAVSSLAIMAGKTARQENVNTIMLQTTAGTLFERLLRISGFKRVFTRMCFTLS